MVLSVTELVREGSALLDEHSADIPSKKMPVFYNPRMSWNRDLFLLVLASWSPVKDFGIAFSGSGVLGIRALLELPLPPQVVHLNDLSESALSLARDNLLRNNLSESSFAFSRREASRFLMDSEGFDALDLDPFGTPIHSLKAAVQSLREGALLGVNALDTAALYGTYPKVCVRRYWARSLKCDSSREFSARILIRRVQLEAAAFDKAVWPVLAVVRDHYVRVFFKAQRGASAADSMLRQHGLVFFDPKSGRISLSRFEGSVEIGPMWTGPIFDADVLDKMLGVCSKKPTFGSRSLRSYVDKWLVESKVQSVGYYDLHSLLSRHLISQMSVAEAARRVEGVQSSFEPHGVKTSLDFDEVIRRLS